MVAVSNILEKLIQNALQAGFAMFSHQVAGQGPLARVATKAAHIVEKEGRKSSSFTREVLNFQ